MITAMMGRVEDVVVLWISVAVVCPVCADGAEAPPPKYSCMGHGVRSLVLLLPLRYYLHYSYTMQEHE